MYSVLVVDDNKTNLQIVKQLLSEKYRVIPVLSGKMALHYVEKQKPDVVLLDLLMPNMDGMETMEKMRKLPNGKDVPVIFLTADQDEETESRCLEAGATDFITKPFTPKVMVTRIEKALELEALRKNLYEKMEENTWQFEEAALHYFLSIAHTIDSRDCYRNRHLPRVAAYAVRLAMYLGFSEEQIKHIEYSSLIYDIGNITIPDSLFVKKEALTEKERMVMRDHTIAGAKLLEAITCIDHIEDIALCHHERYDGTGYPTGRKGEEIPLEARMISIIDAYVAMRSERPYRNSYSKERACEEIRKGEGSQFDPFLAEQFLEMITKEGETNCMEELLVPRCGSMNSSLLMRESNCLLKHILKEQRGVINTMASLDPLTELHSLKYGERKMDAYLMDPDHEGCLFMIDIDYFKSVNDIYGHAAGDKVLQKLAHMLRRNVRETDVVCRIGGDKFCIFFEGMTDKEVIRKKADKFEKEYAHIVLCEEAFSKTSLSIGIAMTVTGARNYIDLSKQAEEALYHVKRNGRSSIQFYGGEEPGQKKEGTGITVAVHDIMEVLEEKEYKKGVYKVTYGDFQRIYHVLSRCVERTGQKIELLVLSLQQQGETEDSVSMERASLILEQVLTGSLRRTDVSTRYSDSQYIVILINTDQSGAFKVAERILSYYKENAAEERYQVTYEIAQVPSPKGRINNS